MNYIDRRLTEENTMRRLVSLLALWAIGMPLAYAAPTVNLTAAPTSGISPLTVTLTWSSTESSSCTASGGWTGTKATSGTQTVTGLMASATFTLTCSSATGSAVLTWTAPTQNEDGTTIAATGPGSLAGFEVFHATTAAGVQTAAPIIVNNKLATTYTITGLPVGVRYYAAKAYNVEGIRSAFSGTVNNTIVLPSATASASVTVNVQPKPPIVTVQQVAYDINATKSGYRVAREVGTIELGVACGDKIVNSRRGADYYEVPLDKVTLTRLPRSAIVVARCDASG